MHRTFLLLLLLLFAVCCCCCYAQSYNPCATASSCCFELSLQRTPGIDGVPLAAGYEISPVFASSPWGAGSLGLKLGLDASMTRPGTSNWLYAFGLLNASAVAVTDAWNQFRHTGLVAVAATTLSPQVQVYQGNTVMWANFSTPACLRSVSLMRTYAMNVRTGVSLTLYNAAGVPIDSQSYPWSLQVQSAWLNVSFATSSVAAIRMSFTGVGYGAFVSLSACYPNSVQDQCGICGGNGSQCAQPDGPQVGAPCFNTSMSNPLCRPGSYNAALQCVPTQLNVVSEQCNGVDDDCDGVVDGNAPVVNVTCGIGACRVVVWGCANGSSANLTCTPLPPSAEICNGLDDDCNGIVDDPPVCAQPVQGVAVVPMALCVEGRLSPASTQCWAHFSWWNSDPLFNVTRPYGSVMNTLAVSPEAGPSPANVSVPSFFVANGSVQDAFRVPIQCQNGGAAIWTLGDGEDHYLEAVVYAASAPPCETYIGRPGALTRPISVFIDSPCTLRSNGTCTVYLGYYNPNGPVYIPSSAVSNSFTAATTSSSTPTMFFPQRVRQAAIVQWPCPLGTETFQWQLQTAGVTHIASISAALSSCPPGVAL